MSQILVSKIAGESWSRRRADRLHVAIPGVYFKSPFFLLSLKVGENLMFICMNACLFGFEHRLELKSHIVAFRLNLRAFSEYTSVSRRILGLG